jgi:hypothetical protein
MSIGGYDLKDAARQVGTEATNTMARALKESATIIAEGIQNSARIMKGTKQ